MDDHQKPGSTPPGLSRSLEERLAQASHDAASASPDALLVDVERHLAKVRLAHEKSALVNARMAEAIAARFRAMASDWDRVPSAARPWLQGAMRYFTLSTDAEPDFTSPIGFEDDLEILNACLRLAGRDELCLKPEDYDDV